VRRVVARVRRRLERLGVVGTTSGDEDVDRLAEESPALAGTSRAAILESSKLAHARLNSPQTKRTSALLERVYCTAFGCDERGIGGDRPPW